jgi:hypothetical protein
MVILRSTNGLAVDSTFNPNRPVRGKKSLPTFPTEVLVFVPLNLAAGGLDGPGIGLIEPPTAQTAFGTTRGLGLCCETPIEALLGEFFGDSIANFIGGQLHLIERLPGAVGILCGSEKIRQFFQELISPRLHPSVHALPQSAKTDAN